MAQLKDLIVTGTSRFVNKLQANEAYIDILNSTTAIVSNFAGGTALTLNDIPKSGNIASIYAPTSAGTSDYVLVSNGSGEPSWVPRTYFGICETVTATVAKTASIENFSLTTGTQVYIKFTNGNSASAATLNVSGTGAKTIYFADQTTYNRNGRTWSGGDTVGFVYDGLSWRLMSAYAKTTNTSYQSQYVQTRTTVGSSTSTKYYCLGAASATTNSGLYMANNTSGSNNTAGIYFKPNEGVLYGAAWNDYAEFRHSEEPIEAGRVVKELGNGTLELVNERLARGCEIVSDTYGFAIGETDYCQLPTAASGRVLAYPDKEPSTFEIGAPVCSGPNGTVSQMTEEEERLYPSRIIGTVSEIPTYEIWHGGKDVEVNGRIWIRIR